MISAQVRPNRLFRLVAVFAVGFAAVGFTAETFSAPASEVVAPVANTAVVPVPKDANWMKRHEGFLAEARQGGIEVLFLGDSITDFWRDAKRGRAIWDREFAPIHAANFGISADRTQHLLWRIENGELDGLHPKVVVLMIGTNNTGLERDNVTPRNTPAEAIEGVKAVVSEIRKRLPESKLLLLAVFPRGATPDYPQRAQIKTVNDAIQKLADGKRVRFLDLGPKFLEPDGTLSAEVMPDFLHPSTKGYEIWAANMKPVLLEML